jgi:hypothetical protein
LGRRGEEKRREGEIQSFGPAGDHSVVEPWAEARVIIRRVGKRVSFILRRGIVE